jgi:alcohol dehydrogenase
VRIRFGCGRLAELGEVCKDEGAARVLLVTDPGIVAVGHADRALAALNESGLESRVFDGARENPTTDHVARGVDMARSFIPDLLVALGGGSAMDCAKGINLIHTNGGAIRDYWGEGKPTKPMLPLVAVPTTAGTGSEAQSFALISDPVSHRKMACGDRRLPAEGGLRPRVAILDPQLTASQPAHVASASGIDAIAHAVETAGTTVATKVSQIFSRQAWMRLSTSFETAIKEPSNDDARSAMLLGAHLAGAAIESSMLGAAHACANPLTARCDIVHGVAVGVMLPHVVAFNSQNGANPYAALDDDVERFISLLHRLREAAGLPSSLSALNVDRELLQELALDAATQWTASFNPRRVDAEALLTCYEMAYA